MPDFQRRTQGPRPAFPPRRPGAQGPGRGNGARVEDTQGTGTQGTGTQDTGTQGTGTQGTQDTGTQAGAGGQVAAAGADHGALAATERTRVSDAAIAALPQAVRGSANTDLKGRVEAAVRAAAIAAFDACVTLELTAAGHTGQAALQDEVTRARTRYDGGPGLAVGKFGQFLDEVRGRAAATDAHVEAALTRYTTRTERSVRVFTGIQQNSSISLLNSHVSGVADDADAADNVRDIVEGETIERSAYGNAPGGTTEPNDTVLNTIIALSATYSFRITELAGGSHSVGSAHYGGNALDVDQINGAGVSSRNRSVAGFMQALRDAGASLVLGPGDDGHSTHVHAQW